MALSVPKGIGSKRQAILLAVLAALLLLFVVRWRPGGRNAGNAGPASAPLARAGGAASDAEDAPARGRRASKTVSPDEVPLLSAKDFGASQGRGSADTGRDLFDLREPTRIPPPTPTPRPPMPGDANYIGPLPPPPPTPTPRPPEISFKFLGTFGPKEHPIAVVQQGDQIFNARAGDTLFGKFVLRKVGYESIDVGFVGYADSETRRLGITP